MVQAPAAAAVSRLGPRQNSRNKTRHIVTCNLYDKMRLVCVSYNDFSHDHIIMFSDVAHVKGHMRHHIILGKICKT
jgi:hypothetical protein